jgi:hypothetical protein
MLADRGHQRRRRRIRILRAQQINSAAAVDRLSHIGSRAAATGDAAAANVILEEQAPRLLHRGNGVARRPLITVQRAVQQAMPIQSGMRVRQRASPSRPVVDAPPPAADVSRLAKNLGRLGRDGRVRHPPQHMIQGAAGQRGGAEERLITLAASAA